MSRYPKHDKAVKSALADVGVAEQPRGSNRGPRVQTYQNATWLGGTGWPWCVAFWLYHTVAAGLEMPWKGAGSYALHDWARKQGWTVPAGEAMPGDAVVFNIGAGHVGMLAATVKDGVVQTVDGNVSDQVDVRSRPLRTVRGFVHVPETPVPIVPKPKPPTFEVVGSVSGHRKIVFSGSRAGVGRWIARTPIHKRYGGVTVRRKT